jgi:hypothetical protein
METLQNRNAVRTIIGALAAIAGILVGLTCLVTIGGLSMCALDVTKGMVGAYLTVLAPLAVVFGYCIPRVWWISPAFLGPVLLITTIELMNHEPERFGATAILAAGMIAGGFAGARIAELTARAPEKRT